MATSLPQLDVYFIDFAKKKPSSNDTDAGRNARVAKTVVAAGAGNLALSVASLILPGAAVLSIVPLLLKMGLDVSPTAIKKLQRLIEENRFYIIDSPEALSQYENAYGNDWVVNSKKLRRKQYYIRHPRSKKCTNLIETQNFYEYIDEEQKDELIDFIMSHCSAKVIKIDRTEIVEVRGKAKANIQGADVYGGGSYGQMTGNYYNFSNPNGAPKTAPREDYFWIDKSIMRSISALTEGASLTQSYKSDFTFGLSVGEAKTIGLNLDMHKKFSYKIHIEC